MINEPTHYGELCRQVGFVVLQAQLVEHNLTMYLATSLRLEQKAAVDQVQDALAAANTKTIEKLLKSVARDFPLDPSLAKRIWDVKDERNWLVHRLQREAPGAVCSSAKAQPVFQRIERLAQAILTVLTDLGKAGDSLMEKHGFNSAEINARALLSMKEKAANQALAQSGSEYQEEIKSNF